MIKEFKNMDCMEEMVDFPDNYFDVAIVDPPYFSGPERRGYYGRKVSPIGVQRVYDKSECWNVPKREYFEEFFGSGRIVWDKCNGKSSFSDCELAYTSFHDSIRLFRHMWNGMMQGKSIEEGWIQQGNKKLNEKRIHPTQKPVNLYRWLVQKYLTPGQLVLDTHVGSGSSLIAFEEYDLQYVGYEIDKKYYDMARQRIEEQRGIK